MIKKLLFTVCVVVAASSYADELKNYNEVKEAILSGKSIHIIINYANCELSSKKSPATGYSSTFTPSEIAIDNDNNQVAAASMHFTIDDPYFMGKAIDEFARYTISVNNNVEVWFQPLDAVTYSPLADKTTYHCQLANGARIYD